MNQPNSTQKIDNYLLGKMSSEEKNAFEQEINQNQDLQKEVEAQRLAHKVIKADVNNLLQDRMNQWEKKAQSQSRIRRLSIIAVSVAAAAVILFLLMPTQSAHLQLYQQHYEPVADFLTPELDGLIASQGFVQGRAEQLKELKEGINFYHQGQAQKAIPILDKYLSSGLNVKTKEVQLYLALSYLATQQSPQAIPLLSALSQDTAFAQATTARWYHALALVQDNQLAEAKEVLESLQEDSTFDEEARELLEGIRE
jgi:hypothetical protein